MADANELKIQARRHEAAGDYEKASQLYLRALSAMDAGGNLSDPSLLVRVADLQYRQNDEPSALEYYRQAVEEYAQQGLITNAIAVCNKILRVFPREVGCHRRLADLHMDVGLTAEARQNLLRYVEEAWDPENPGIVLDAMGAFLDRTPDQEVALRLASHLQELGRPEDALDELKAVWEERTRAGADVEALTRKAEKIHSEAGVEEWSREDEEPEEPEELPSEGVEPEELASATGEPDEQPSGTPEPQPDEPASATVKPEEPAPDAPEPPASPAAEHEAPEDEPEEAWAGPAGPEPGREVGEAAEPAGLDRGLELVASFQERLTQAGEPAGGGGPASPAVDEEDAAPARAERRPPASEATESPVETAERPAEEDAQAPREEEIMEELDELDRASEVATADQPSAGGEAPPEMPSGEEELGEEAELRRGLELVDEMLEVQPDNLDLRERKLRYARRLGDEEVLVDASLEFADALAKEGARRSARALYRRVLELDPENQPAESGLARLDVGELEEKRQSGKRAGAARATPEAASPGDQEARRELGMRLWAEFENSIREMPWLHAATQAYQATAPESLPPLETFEMLAHYLLARERYRDAAEILERALELAEEGDDGVADVLYYLGRAYEKLGEDDRASAYYERLESVDPEFARVRGALSDAHGS